MAGIRGQQGSGHPIEERATITVGADGRNSKLARTVQARVYNDVPTLTGYYFSYWSGVEAEPFELHFRPAARRAMLCFRTEDSLYAIFLTFPIEDLPEFRGDIEKTFMRSLDLVPDLAERVRSGRREERFYGATDLPNFYREPFGPGWALVRDAGLHKDPLLALRICDALRDAEFLAGALFDGLGGRRPLGEALAEYERRRNEASDSDYQENIAGARFTGLPPDAIALRAAIRNDQVEATRFIKARMRMIEPSEFFNPANIQRLMRRSGAQCA